MQLIQRTTLLYQEGRSDKIYEVDLCKLEGDRYVVNFRYGRRGANLKEGVKTEQAVPLAEAERAFEQLVKSKTVKGYRDVTTETVSDTVKTVAAVTPAIPTVGDPRHQAILQRLARPKDRNSKWKLERAIWRAGELRIREAVPLLLPLVGTGKALQDYCIAAALGWCSDPTAISALKSLLRNAKTPEFVKRIAWEAIYKLSNEQQRIELKSPLYLQLPTELQQIAWAETAENFRVLQAYLQGTQRYTVLELLYQFDTHALRPAFLEWLRTTPLRPPAFKAIRHIFKMAEYRLDAEVFGIIAYRLEKEAAMYSSSNSYYVQFPGGGYIRQKESRYNQQTRSWETWDTGRFQKEMESPTARIAYSNKTRDYLRQRVWRTLRKLGEQSDPAYTKMAAGVLLSFADTDAQPVRQSVFYQWDRQTWTQTPASTIDWDTYAPYLTLNHILYTHSPRYELKLNSRAWRCRSPYKPGDPQVKDREEAFPQLWEQHPEDLLQLLLMSNCAPVHEFAIKAIRVSREFLNQLALGSVIGLVESRYAVTANLGFELARERYQTNAPNLHLAVTVANCILPAARAEGFRWIEAQREFFLADSQFIALLVTSMESDTRQFIRRLCSSSHLQEQVAQAAIGRIIAVLMRMEPSQGETVKEIGETLSSCFATQLRSLGLGIVLDLLRHPVLEVQELGASILLNHKTGAIDLPPGTIDALINSPHTSIRVLGIQLFGQLPDAILLERDRLLLTMTIHKLEEIRNAIRPVINRLGSTYPDFGLRFAAVLIDMLVTEEEKEGIHSYILRVLQEDLTGWIPNATKAMALELLQATSPAGQELGGTILGANAMRWADTFETRDIVQFADREILAIRAAARDMLLQILPRMRRNTEELITAVKLLESSWEDSREFGYRLFATFFSPDDFTPTVLVSLCDSNRPDVRKFGRDRIGCCFQSEDGQEYLMKFSEHPAADMQLYATNYLETYAVDNPDRLQALVPYFIRVLSQVNRGRIAKQRIFAFLDRESQKSASAARIIAEVLTRQSATIAIGDKAAAIQIMLKIHRTHPQISLPIRAIAAQRR